MLGIALGGRDRRGLQSRGFVSFNRRVEILEDILCGLDLLQLRGAGAIFDYPGIIEVAPHHAAAHRSIFAVRDHGVVGSRDGLIFETNRLGVVVLDLGGGELGAAGGLSSEIRPARLAFVEYRLPMGHGCEIWKK